MSRPILSRPRTFIYGSNYDKGESYYKPMVDHLDRKYSSRPLFPEPRNSLADEIAARRSDIGNLFSRFPKWFWRSVAKKTCQILLERLSMRLALNRYSLCKSDTWEKNSYPPPPVLSSLVPTSTTRMIDLLCGEVLSIVITRLDIASIILDQFSDQRNRDAELEIRMWMENRCPGFVTVKWDLY